MRNRQEFQVLLSLLPILMYGCSYRYLHRPFSNFSQSTDVIGKNTNYLFQQMQEEEIEVRIAEVLEKEVLAPGDLEPRVMTLKNLALREELVGYIVNYATLLESLVTYDYQQDIQANALRVHRNLSNININHQYTLSMEETGLISSMAALLPEAVVSVRNRSFILQLMNEQQPILTEIVGALKDELQVGQRLIENFYSRQFRVMAAEPWSREPAGRQQYARVGAKILDKKRKINVIFQDLRGALDVIPQTHNRLLGFVKTNKGPLRTLAQLVNFAARVESNYREFSKETIADQMNQE